MSTDCRILFLVGQLGGGGLEQQVCYLLKGMDRQRYRPGIAVWNYDAADVHSARIRELEVPTWGYPLGMSSLAKLRELTRLARRLSPEVIHSYTFFTNFAAYFAGLRAGSVALGSIRNELDLDLIKEKPVLGRLSSALPRIQISNSRAAAEKAMRAERRFRPRQVRVVQNGLDLERFHDASLPMGPPYRILGIGSLAASKRWDRLLSLGRSLDKRGIDCRIQIAGEGPMRPRLEAMAQEFGIAGRTDFLGYRTDVAELLPAARLIVHVSDGEGTPNAIMEAMAAGRPVVATDVGDVGRIVENGTTGYVVPRDDAAALLDRVLTLLKDDRLALAMGAAAKEFARHEFGLERLVRETFDVYRAAGWKDAVTP